MERRAITVQGIVQGVGFRPFVYGLASRLGLGGFVLNRSGSVSIEVEGASDAVEQFLCELRTHAPPLAQIDEIRSERRSIQGDIAFQIKQSEADGSPDVRVSPDIATCDDCLAELFDPANRRWRYPFINCVNCGPRLTIIQGAPYDRALTTMASFQMCDSCRVEYENPRDRRYHAQPIACAACGPSLTLLDSNGKQVPGDPLRFIVQAIRQGRIVAIKGLGGFHLACDPRNASAVQELRRRKHRDEKPFAVMVPDLASARALCNLDDVEERLLTSRARPIVLLRKRDGIELASGIAPGGNPFLGVMLPYTPLHHLLLRDLAGDPAALVMTSGNRSDEPIAYVNEDALARLATIADLFLMHDRPIHVRCDDSVTQVCAGRESPVRRSRGYAPQPLRLTLPCREPGLAVGGQMKGTFALGRGAQAIISHHLGDLDELSAFRAFERDIELYQRSFSIQPSVIAHDMHPDYASTRYALHRCATERLHAIEVQHHHAHMASCMAEHGLNEPVIGVCFDGTGFGTDGAIWGGEFLVGDLREFRRAAQFRYVPMPGGEQAIKQPWRMAIAHLLDAEVEPPVQLVRRLDPAALKMVRQMTARRLNSPLTSSVGRLFDAVAALTSVRDTVEFEGQAAMQLQWLAEGIQKTGQEIFPYAIIPAATSIASARLDPLQIDVRPMISQIADMVSNDADADAIAARFHMTLCQIIVDVAERVREQSGGINKVVLSGGVFMNAILLGQSVRNLADRGFCPFRHERGPTNDGGISLGQLAVAAARMHDSPSIG